ncbi:hypothetical protein WKW80_20410 [Variovorax humicola]|uniref:DUF2783 domain-containing protein n=1 Tax=Variovorax humicola TaxID=1769758 RepID=A0ABU8W2U3_9BURK
MTTDTLPAEARDRLYAQCARAITEAGTARESLFLARLALLLFEQVGDETRCNQALADALHALPTPSLSESLSVSPPTSVPPSPETTT